MDTTVKKSLGPVPTSSVTQAQIDELRGEAPNVLICIGFLGGLGCYLNVDLDTAIERFRKEFHGEGELADPYEYSLQAIAFVDSFEAYDITV